MNKFDTLAKECQEMNFEEGWKRIWTEVFSLEKILIAVRTPVDEQDKTEPLLFLGTMNEEPCIFAFSDDEHYEDFHKHVIESGDERELSKHKLSVEEFLNFTQHMAFQNIAFAMFNFGSVYGFHTKNQDVLSMHNAFMKGDYLQEQRVEQGTMISVAVPKQIEEMKATIEAIKMNYKSTLNTIAPIIVRVGQREDLTLVLGFKGGLPTEIKKSVMQNLHKDLGVSPLFQAQIFFTEEQSLIPPDLGNVLQVRL